MMPKDFAEFKTQPIITVHNDRFNVTGEIILIRKQENEFDILKYNFNVQSLDAIVPRIKFLVEEHYKVQQFQ